MENSGSVIHGVSQITEHDIYLFKQGNHFRLYERLGARAMDGWTSYRMTGSALEELATRV